MALLSARRNRVGAPHTSPLGRPDLVARCPGALLTRPIRHAPPLAGAGRYARTLLGFGSFHAGVTRSAPRPARAAPRERPQPLRRYPGMVSLRRSVLAA